MRDRVSDTVLDCKEQVMAKCKGNVPKWVQKFKNGFENVHEESRSGRPSVVSENFVFAVHAEFKNTEDSQ